jgi:hypothetical protein
VLLEADFENLHLTSLNRMQLRILMQDTAAPGSLIIHPYYQKMQENHTQYKESEINYYVL